MTTCPQCGVDLTPEDKLLSAIFSDGRCSDCAKREQEKENPPITVNGQPLGKYLEKGGKPHANE